MEHVLKPISFWRSMAVFETIELLVMLAFPRDLMRDDIFVNEMTKRLNALIHFSL